MMWWLALFCSLSFSADEGQLVPEVSAKLFSGENFSLQAARGQVVIFHVWASWCEACKAEMPILDAYYRQHRTDGLKVVAINVDGAAELQAARDFMQKYSFDAAFARNGNVKALGRVWKIPLNFLIDRKGILKKDGWNLGRSLVASDLESTVTPLLTRQ